MNTYRTIYLMTLIIAIMIAFELDITKLRLDIQIK
jgi:hypothetical protein